MKPRKIILLSACAILLCICILQAVLKQGDKIKSFKVSEKPDEITIKTPATEFTLTKDGDEWLIGDKKYTGNTTTIESLINSASTLKGLEKVGSLSNDTIMNRYELNKEKENIVTLKKEGKVLTEIHIGKTSSTGSQSYATIGNSKDIYLMAGNLEAELVKNMNDLRSKTIYKYNASEVNAVSITTYDGNKQNNFSIARLIQGEDTMWTFSEPDKELDEDKASEWFASLASLSTNKWYEDSDKPTDGRHVLTAKIEAGKDHLTLEVYEVLNDEGKVTSSYATCNNTPYTFGITGSTINKYKKDTGYFEK